SPVIVRANRVALASSFLVPPVRPASASTLFPYTTLFRSDAASRRLAARARRNERDVAPLHRRQNRRRRPGGRGAARRRAGGGRRDRKSTRLNSSHVKISYAVFCLKKKSYHLEERGHTHND